MAETTNAQRAPLHLPFIIVAVFALVAMVLVALLYVLGADLFVDKFTGFFLTVFVGLTGFAASVYQLGKRDQVIEEIRSNVNGNLSKAQQDKAALEAQLHAAGIKPVTLASPLD